MLGSFGGGCGRRQRCEDGDADNESSLAGWYTYVGVAWEGGLWEKKSGGIVGLLKGVDSFERARVSCCITCMRGKIGSADLL